MAARLVVIAGPDRGKSFPLSPAGPLLVGRASAAGARLTDPHVSRSHCQVDMNSGRAVVHALDGVRGLFVNDERVQSQPLRPGDVIRIGSTLLRLEVEGGEDPFPPAPPPPPSGILGPADTALEQPLSDLAGRALAHFQLGPVIAPGKSGVVFRAIDTRDGKEVALKVFHPGFARDEADQQRFLRAMKTTLPLRHPHLVAVNSAGRTGAHCWVSMELVEGVSLAPAIGHAASGAIDWRFAFRTVKHVSRALAYLHARSVYHRNIAPNNILLSTLDGAIKLGDLMSAKAREGKQAWDVTQAGEIVGDIRYLSPEQSIRADAGDGRADLYSLGATAYALLVGRPPLEGRNVVETILQIRQTVPLPPRSFAPGVPPAFDDTVMKLLAKEPGDRFQSAAELLDHLATLGARGG